MKYLDNFEQLQWIFVFLDQLLKALSLLYLVQYQATSKSVQNYPQISKICQDVQLNRRVNCT